MACALLIVCGVCTPPPQVLTELVGDKSLERFRQEYEKLHRALRKSHESEKRLIKKCAARHFMRCCCYSGYHYCRTLYRPYC